jgi:predicted amidohydrolase YtcJ
MDAARPGAEALAVDGEYISELPGDAAVERVDLRGRCLLPAFSDSHVHFPSWALAQRSVRFEDVTSLAEALERVRTDARKDGIWVRGRGWRDDTWAEKPTAAALDAVTGSRPAAMWAQDGHSLWLNSAGLALAREDLETPGGVVERDEHGAPTGVLREEAAWRFRELYIFVSEEEWLDATSAGIQVAHTRGVAAIHDKDGWIGSPTIFGRLHESGVLTLRVWQSLPAANVGALAELGLRPRLGDDWFRLGYLKAFMDGTLGSRTASMLDGSGITITTKDELAELILAGAALGWPMAVHAIGDRANRDALDAFEATRGAWQPQGLRHRIEHTSCLAAEDVPRFAALGVAASVQFSFAPSDRDLADRYWSDRLDGAYCFRSLWDSGAVVVNGSDAPVEELDPLAGIRAGVLRTIDDRPGWTPSEAVSVEQSLLASTVTPAWLAGDESRRGRLLPGYLADLVVLDDDPLACTTDELEGIGVVATMVGGQWVHNPPPWD